jgi:hypothetical protein
MRIKSIKNTEPLPVQITTWSQYQSWLKAGFEPLGDWRFFINIDLRIEIQYLKFCGSINRINLDQANQKFYKYCYDNSLKICAETGQPIHHYQSAVVSHILSRSNKPEMAFDPRNVNILIPQMHAKWECKNRAGENKEMRIYKRNQIVIRQLLLEYR